MSKLISQVESGRVSSQEPMCWCYRSAGSTRGACSDHPTSMQEHCCDPLLRRSATGRVEPPLPDGFFILLPPTGRSVVPTGLVPIAGCGGDARASQGGRLWRGFHRRRAEDSGDESGSDSGSADDLAACLEDGRTVSESSTPTAPIPRFTATSSSTAPPWFTWNRPTTPRT